MTNKPTNVADQTSKEHPSTKDPDQLIRDLVTVALFAACISVVSIIPGFQVIGPVPITLQSLMIMVTGLLLDPKKACAAVGLFLILIAIGLPLASGGVGGIGAFFRPTSGYLFGFLAGVFCTSLLSKPIRKQILLRKSSATPAAFVKLLGSAVLGGIVVVYLFGVIGLKIATGSTWLNSLYLGAIPFVLPDLVKAVLATVIAWSVLRTSTQTRHK